MVRATQLGVTEYDQMEEASGGKRRTSQVGILRGCHHESRVTSGQLIRQAVGSDLVWRCCSKQQMLLSAYKHHATDVRNNDLSQVGQLNLPCLHYSFHILRFPT
jgi:DNA-binding transcriptional regulator YdaS (Cro superfamily)